jgi:2'-5' RNA ligase
MEETRHFSLWLAFEGGARERAAALIEELSRAHGTPSFEPHVTVLGRVSGRREDLAVARQRLAAETPPLTIALTRVEHEAAYHRALFVVAEAPELRALHARAAAAFGVPADASYRPHLSLLYGDLTAVVKEDILDHIGRRFDWRFETRRLELWATGGPPQGWRKVVGGERLRS